MGLSFARQCGMPAAAIDALPEPEDVFLLWLLRQPADGDMLAAASQEIERLSRYTGNHDGPRQLMALFKALIEERGYLGRSCREGAAA